MSSLPFISHHLFVAAIATDMRPDHKSSSNQKPNPARTDHARAIPLHVMDRHNPMPATAPRPLRILPNHGGA